MSLNEVISQKGLTKMKIAMMSGVNPPDLYQAINGKKPFFPAWRKRIAEALEMSEEELFPEYIKKEG